MQWADDVLLYNGNSSPATIRLLSFSNAGIPTDLPTTVTIASQQAMSLNAATRTNPWRPSDGGGTGTSALSGVHLDVPTGVVIDSRDEFFAVDAPCLVVGPYRVSLGKLSLPVYRSLQPAGKPKVFLGSDLGGRNLRVNVGIYNAGTAPATVQLQLRRVCDGSVDDERVITVPPQTTLQYGSLHKGSDDTCTADPITPPYQRYTVVTADQPSLSYVSVLAPARTDDDPNHLAPIVELAVPLNTEY